MAALPGGGRSRQGRPPSVPDTVVTTTDELESAFADLSGGETVYVTDENAPYRTSRWLDIDQSGVSVVGPGVEELVKPADGSNVGGIRVGHNSHCENVVVRGVGYHGNPENQRRAARRRHGIIVRDATNVTLDGNLVTRTHPYHQHNWGGSGISVESAASSVRVLNNRIYDIGDRGIQLAGRNIVVMGNSVTNGFDRSISCDAWAPDGSNSHAHNVVVLGNVCGGNPQGSVTGIGGNPSDEARGYVTIAHNVGFGQHKSFCHVGGRGAVRNFTIEGNVSVQEGSRARSAVSADIQSATNLTVTNNHFYDYDGHGVKLGPGISDFRISNNSIFSPSQAGVRVSASGTGSVESNYIKNARPGVILDGTQRVTVAGNRIRQVAVAGIITRSGTPTNHEIRDNFIDNRDTETSPPAIVVEDSGNCVRRNHVNQRGPPAIREVSGAGNNLYVENWADGESPWQISSPTSTVRNHAPPIDVHRGVTDEDSDGVVTVEFDKPYASRPKLDFGRVGGGIEEVSYTTGSNDNFDGAEIAIGNAGATIDVSVEEF